MVILPDLFSSPLLAAVAGGVNFPAFGAILAWAMIAALIGSAVGVLRGNGRRLPTAVGPLPRTGVETSPYHYFDRPDSNKEAA